MDAFAYRQNRINDVPWLSVNWDTWQFLEETPQILESRVAIVELGLTPAEGMEIFKRVLSMDNVTPVVVSTRELESRIESWIKHTSLHEREALKSAASPLLHARPNVATAFIGPGSALEQKIADVWQEYLGIDQVGVHDNFFDLGGHSLLATQVVAKLEKMLGVRIAPAEVIYNTLGQLASNCEEQLDLPGSVHKPEYKPVQISEEVREPFYFGTPEKPLFGCYHEPLSGPPKDCGIVLCNPMGQEYIKCHRTYLQLAVRLARVGFPVLRFDYYGTGDSSGNCEQGNSRQWIADIFAAIDELKRRNGLSKVCLVGLRLGGTLSMIAGAELSDVDSLILCDPIVYGDAYISELHKLHKQMLKVSYVEIKHHTKGANPTEILGFPMLDFMFADLAEIDLVKIQKKPSRNILLIQSGIDTSFEHLRDHLLSFETQLTCQQISMPKIWLEEAFKGLVPHQFLDSAVSWLLEVYK
jgi:acyl carrier protein